MLNSPSLKVAPGEVWLSWAACDVCVIHIIAKLSSIVSHSWSPSTAASTKQRHRRVIPRDAHGIRSMRHRHLWDR